MYKGRSGQPQGNRFVW